MKTSVATTRSKRASVRAQVVDRIGVHQRVVDAERRRLGEHARREVETGQALGQGPQQRAAQSGAAAEVERVAVGPAIHGDQLVDEPGVGPIAQAGDEMLVEGLGIVVEQGLHIVARRRRRRCTARHRGEVVGVQIGVGAVAECLAKSVRGLVEPTELAQQRAAAAPGIEPRRIDGEDALEGRERLAASFEPLERLAAPEPAFDDVAIPCQQAIEGGQGFIEPAQPQ